MMTPQTRLASGEGAGIHRPTGRRGDVQPLLVQEQVDALGVEFAQEVQKVDQGPAAPTPGGEHGTREIAAPVAPRRHAVAAPRPSLLGS
jgi:hypothetical protein